MSASAYHTELQNQTRLRGKVIYVMIIINIYVNVILHNNWSPFAPFVREKAYFLAPPPDNAKALKQVIVVTVIDNKPLTTVC